MSDFDVIRPQAGAQERFLASSADICIFGGAAGGGKSVALLMEPIRHIHVKGFGGVLFRREAKELTMEGGLVSKALQIYPQLGGLYRSQPTPSFTFQSGAKISFGHLNQETEVLAWKGSEICYLAFDEADGFTDFQINYMLSRNRSTCGVRPYVRMSVNPDADSWIAKYLEWWINQETGYPIPERSGIIRYLIRVDGERIWGDSREELMEKYGCDYNDAKTVSFIPSRITDNPILLKKDPGYLANLKGMTRVERARLLDGNWLIRPSAGDYFPRDAVTIIDWIPNDVVKWVRSWDLAASEEGEGRDVDWTVGMLIGRRSNGKIVIGDVVRVRRKANEVQSLVKNLAVKDGDAVWVVMPQDPGAAGKSEKESYQRLLHGFTVLTRTINKNKVLVASSGADSPAALWQRGEVEIVRANWNKDFLDECDAFPTKGVHDDQCFVEGTLIATEFGEIPIEDVTRGMMVWTRQGWKRVIECGITSKSATVITVDFGNGLSLTGTENHPIICDSNRIVLLKDISLYDKICLLKDDTLYGELSCLLVMLKKAESITESARWLSIMVQGFIVTQTQKIKHIGITSLQAFKQNKMELIYSIGKYGKITSEKYQKDTVFTTRTRIQSTMTYRISNALLRNNIFIGILKGLHTVNHLSNLNILQGLESKQRSGIVVKKVLNGISNMLVTAGLAIIHWLTPNVLFVEMNFKRREKQTGTIVLMNVLERIYHRNGMKEKGSSTNIVASVVEKSLSQTKQHQDFVQDHVLKENKSVYNLTIEDSHEYFANGILVHNCDALSNGIRALPGHSKPDYSTSGLSGRFKQIRQVRSK